MNAGTAPSPAESRPYRLRVSRYDQVSSMLIALLVLIGLAVLLLLIIWLTNQIFLSQVAVPVELVELGEGEGPLAGDDKLEGPLDEEIELEEPNLQDTLAAVADAVAAKAAVLSDPSLSNSTRRGRGGDGRGLGSGGSGISRNWELRFIKGNTLEVYARQLDYFGIELGVLMPDNKVIYVSELSADDPKVREGPADQEKRYYLTWRSGGLMAADRELLTRAGVSSGSRIILKFLPPQLEARLQQMVKDEATTVNEDVRNVRKTRFGIRPAGRDYIFYILGQSYKR